MPYVTYKLAMYTDINNTKIMGTAFFRKFLCVRDNKYV